MKNSENWTLEIIIFIIIYIYFTCHALSDYVSVFHRSFPKQEHKNPEQITRSVAFAVAFWRRILWSVFAHSICSLGWENTADFCPNKEQRQALISFNVLLKIDVME